MSSPPAHHLPGVGERFRGFDQFAGAGPGVLDIALDEEIGKQDLGRGQMRIGFDGLLKFHKAGIDVAFDERRAGGFLFLGQRFGFDGRVCFAVTFRGGGLGDGEGSQGQEPCKGTKRDKRIHDDS